MVGWRSGMEVSISIGYSGCWMLSALLWVIKLITICRNE